MNWHQSMEHILKEVWLSGGKPTGVPLKSRAEALGQSRRAPCRAWHDTDTAKACRSPRRIQTARLASSGRQPPSGPGLRTVVPLPKQERGPPLHHHSTYFSADSSWLLRRPTRAAQSAPVVVRVSRRAAVRPLLTRSHASAASAAGQHQLRRAPLQGRGRTVADVEEEEAGIRHQPGVARERLQGPAHGQEPALLLDACHRFLDRLAERKACEGHVSRRWRRLPRSCVRRAHRRAGRHRRPAPRRLLHAPA